MSDTSKIEEKEPRRDNNLVIIFVVLFIIVFGLLTWFLIKSGQNTQDELSPSLSSMDADFAAKLEPLQKRLKENPKDDKALTEIGYLYLESQVTREAINNFEAAVDINPDNIEAMLGLGISYQSVGRTKEAAPLFDKVLEKQPDNTLAKVRKAYLLATEGETSEAIKLFRQVETSTVSQEIKDEVKRSLDEILDAGGAKKQEPAE